MSDYQLPDISNESIPTRMLYGGIRAKFPQVQQLSTETLNTWLNDEFVNNSVLLLDVREDEEFKISHIENAVHIQPDLLDFSNVVEQIRRLNIKKVVAYCSVGYRSSSTAKSIYNEMKHHDLSNIAVEVYNLEGSIFKWANENRGRIINNSGAPCDYVHPYSIMWCKFLESSKRKWP